MLILITFGAALFDTIHYWVSSLDTTAAPVLNTTPALEAVVQLATSSHYLHKYLPLMLSQNPGTR